MSDAKQVKRDKQSPIREAEQPFTTRQYMVNPDFEFYHYKDEPSLDVGYHNHEFYEIYFLISGNVNYIVEGKNYSLKPDDILLINNRELHKPDIKRGAVYERIVLWVNPALIKRLSTDGTNLFHCFESTSKNKFNLLRPDAELLGTIKAILYRLNKHATGKSYGNDLLSVAYLTELLVYLNKAFLETGHEAVEEDIVYDQKVSRIIQYINQNLSGDLTLESLSEKFYTSKYHLSREFKKHTGFTLHNYISRKRLIYARSLLSDNSRITEVCQMCGFGDYSNFIRSFRSMYKVSPKQYARQHGSRTQI